MLINNKTIAKVSSAKMYNNNPSTSRCNIFAERDGLPTHESSGARQMMHGFSYQFSMIMLWILRALKSSLTPFKIYTEDEKLGKFDDFAFIKLKDDTIESQIFVQIKHKQSDNKIKFIDLFPPNKNKNFDIRIFFLSYMKRIKNSLDENKSVNNTKLILYTNRDFEFGSEIDGLVLDKDIFNTLADNNIFSKELFSFKSEFHGRSKFIKKIINNTNYKESDVNEFLNIFYIVVNGEKISELENKIKQELELYFDKNNIDTSYNQYNSDFPKWYNSKKGTVIDSKSINQYFLLMRDKITKKLNFNLLPPNTNFHGRVDQLVELDNYVVSSKKSKFIDVLVTGTAGVGKSELVRKCASKLSEHFQHILWLNAETKETLQSSYNELARYLSIPVNEEDNTTHADNIIRKIIDFLSDRKCLFIFDNAESYLFNDFSQYLGLLNSNHRTIITSQLQDWPCTREICLDVFTKEDAVDFLQENLSFDSTNRTILNNIANLLSYLPLALQMSVAYVNKITKRNKMLGKNYTIQDFQSDYVNCNEEFLNLKFIDARILDNYNKSLHLAWKLTLDSISCETNGDKAIEILHIMSFLEADNIPIQLFGKNYGAGDILLDIVYLLKSYSLIKCGNGNCSIHRLLQDVIRAKLELHSNEHPKTREKSDRKLILQKALECVIKNPGFKNIGHIFRLWDSIKFDLSLRNYLFSLHENSNHCHFYFYADFSSKSIEILKFQQKYLQELMFKSKSIFDVAYTLRGIYKISSVCRNFVEISPVFDQTYSYIQQFVPNYNFLLLGSHFIDFLSAYSYCLYQSKNYDKSISLFDEIILYQKSNNENLALYECIFSVYEHKANALIWQQRYQEALTTLITLINEALPYEFQHRWINPCYSDQLQIVVLNLTYIVNGAKDCHRTLKIFLNWFPRTSDNAIDILLWIADLYRIQGDLLQEIYTLEEIFTRLQSRFCSNKECFVHREVRYSEHMQFSKIDNAFRGITDDLHASFKRGSLTKLCEKLKEYLFLAEPQNSFDEIIVSNLQFKLVNLLCKNGDYESAITHLKELSSHFLASLNSTNPEVKNASYQQSICDLAMAYFGKGDSRKAIDILDLANTDNKYVFITTKANILLMDNVDYSEAINYLNIILSQLDPLDATYLQIQHKICEIYTTRGNKKLALQILNKYPCEANTDNDKQYWLSSIQELKLDILECIDDEALFFNLFETWITHFKKNELFSELADDNKLHQLVRRCQRDLDKCKCLDAIIFNLSQPFCTTYNDVSKYREITYYLYKLKKFDESLLEIQKLKDDKLNFIFQSEYIKYILRFEKLVKYRMKNTKY